MEEAKVRREIAYAERGGDSLKLDLYQPAAEGTGAGFPVVILVHGDAPPDAVRNAKDWGLLTSYGKLIAASGMAAVTFNHRSSEEGVRIYDAERDVADLIRYVRAHAADLGVDPGRVAVWTFSSSASYGMSAAMSDDPSWLRCLVAYYGAMDLPALRKRFPRRVLDDTLRAFSPRELLRSHPGRLPPILVTRADLDAPDLKEGVDRFVEDARARGVDVTLLTHPNGRPSFDLLDDDPKSAAIVRETLAFVAKSLGVK
jgi:acetyl esterase/lipase